MKPKMKVAGIQIAGSDDRERNLRRAGEMIAVAAANHAKLAILPELWAYPWFVHQLGDEAKELAQPSDGPLIAAMREKAREHKLFLVVPFFEKDEASGLLYNSAVLLKDDGETAGLYRKIHVPQLPGWEERHYFAPGDLGFPVFETPLGKLGIQLGWDMLYPEGLRLLALAGAEIVAAPMAVTAANDDLWQRVALAGAFTNGLWVCRVGRVGRENGFEFAGGSLCATPTGDLLDDPAADAEGVSLWEVDRRVVPIIRRDWPLLPGRRPDQYGRLTEAVVEPAPAAEPSGEEGESAT